MIDAENRFKKKHSLESIESQWMISGRNSRVCIHCEFSFKKSTYEM